MSKKKQTNRSSGEKSLTSKIDLPQGINPRAAERALQQITRELEKQDFKTIEEADAFLQELIRTQSLPAFEPMNLTPLERAQDLVYEAFSAVGEERLELLVRALATSWECTDAYCALAEVAALTAEEALSLYQQGLRAAERILDPGIFTEEVGNFWSIIETRPYMRAREGMAKALWVLGRHPESLDHYREMLRLNPNDNQGNRYVLATLLLEEKLHDEAAELFARYDDDWAASWKYNRALLAFRTEGDSEHARTLLAEALEQNRHVPGYILGRKKMPKELPAFIGMGDTDEAVAYVEDAGTLWQQTPGALEWLERIAPSRKTRAKS